MDTSRWRFFIPLMNYRRSKVNMPHSRSSFSRRSYFYTTSFTYNSLISHSLILSTTTFKILHRTKDRLTKKSSLLWFSCPIVNGIWIIHYSTRPFFNFLHWSECHHQSVKFYFIHWNYCIGYKNLIFLTLFAQNLLSPQLLYQSFLPLILLHPHLHLKI